MKNTPIYPLIIFSFLITLIAAEFSLAQTEEAVYNNLSGSIETPVRQEDNSTAVPESTPSYDNIAINVLPQGEPEDAERNPFIPLLDENNQLRRDFHRPLATDVTLTATLSGICVMQKIPYAIIDGELLKEGDMFQEFLLEKIGPDSATLKLKDTRFILQLEPKQNAKDNK